MTMRAFSAASIVAATFAFGCQSAGADAAQETEGVDPTKSGVDGDDGDGTIGTGSGTLGATSEATTATTMSPADTTPAEDTAIPEPPIDFDLGMLPDAPMLSQQCTKVDFMFVIDNSGSMYAEQANLVANFPAFISGIQDSLEEVSSYHVGVITTDSYSPNKPGCNALSSLVVQTGGGDSSNQVCATGPGTTYADGYNFMTENDDLATTFSCAAQIGTSGSAYERPMQAVVEAAQGLEGGPGQCNEGFIREDALLVVVVITDEADGPGDSEGLPPNISTGDTMSWYDAVVAAKDGIPENVVALALVNYAGGACPPQSTYDDGQNIVDFAQLFGPNGFVGGICEPDYGPIFQQAIDVIDMACENYIPPG
jgi:hypothetical protein